MRTTNQDNRHNQLLDRLARARARVDRANAVYQSGGAAITVLSELRAASKAVSSVRRRLLLERLGELWDRPKQSISEIMKVVQLLRE